MINTKAVAALAAFAMLCAFAPAASARWAGHAVMYEVQTQTCAAKTCELEFSKAPKKMVIDLVSCSVRLFGDHDKTANGIRVFEIAAGSTFEFLSASLVGDFANSVTGSDHGSIVASVWPGGLAYMVHNRTILPLDAGKRATITIETSGSTEVNMACKLTGHPFGQALP